MLVTEVRLSTTFSDERMEAEYYAADALNYLRAPVDWVPARGLIRLAQYGTSRPLNEEGEGYKVFRLNEIDGVFLTQPEKSVVLPQDQFAALELKQDDILFCRTNGNVRYVGRAGILKDDVEAVFASYLVRLRPVEARLLPEYLAVYLNGRVGRAFIERQAMHSNQFNVSAEQLKRIPVPLAGMSVQCKVKELVDEAARLRNSSGSLFSQARTVVLRELGAEAWPRNHGNTHTAMLSHASGVGRMDAEYFRPAYQALIEGIKGYRDGYSSLLAVADPLSPGSDAAACPHATMRYIELADIDPSIGVVRNTTEFLGADAPSRARRRVCQGEVIASRVEGSLNKAAIVDEAHAGCLASTGFIQLRPVRVSPQVLLVFLRTCVLGSQMERECTGTILASVPERSLSRLLVPLMPKGVEAQVTALVRNSHAARQRSAALVRATTQMVDHVVEGALHHVVGA